MAAEPADRRTLFFGDSFVAGAGDPECRGWVGRVGAASAAAGMRLTAYPLGVRHETSVQVAERWERETAPRLMEGTDCRVVFSFGANDATIEDGRRRVEPAVSVRTLAGVLDAAAGRGLPAFVVGPPPVCEPGQDSRISRLSAQFSAVCAGRDVPFVSVVEALAASAAWVREAKAGDGVHPGSGGYDALAQLVLAGGWLDWIG